MGSALNSPLHALNKDISFCGEFLTEVYYDGTLAVDFLHSYSHDTFANDFRTKPSTSSFLNRFYDIVLLDNSVLKYDF